MGEGVLKPDPPKSGKVGRALVDTEALFADAGLTREPIR